MREPFVSGSFDFSGLLRVNALSEDWSGLPAWVGYCHEAAHMEITSFSAVGLFQGLLKAITQSSHLAEKELASAQALQDRLMKGMFLTQEGVAIYCASVHILAREPSLLPTYINTLTTEYRRAFRSVAPLLPRPHGLKGRSDDAYRYRTLAVLLGMFCCSTPILDVFDSRDQLLQWSSVKFEEPDICLVAALRNSQKHLAVAEAMLPVLARDLACISELWDTSRLEGHFHLQAKWIEWTDYYEEMIRAAGLARGPMAFKLLREKLYSLVEKWDVAEHYHVLSHDEMLERGPLLISEAYLPAKAILNVQADLQTTEQVSLLLAKSNDSSKTLLVVRDFLPASFTRTSRATVNSDGNLEWTHTEPGEMEIIIADVPPGHPPPLKEPLSVSRIKMRATEVRNLIPLTTESKFVWFVDGISYLRRQIMKSPNIPGFRLPNATLYFRTLADLLGGMQTVLLRFNEHTYGGVIEGPPELAFLAVQDEFMFALVPSEFEMHMFLAAVEKLGVRKWEFSEPNALSALQFRARCSLIGISTLNALEKEDGD